MYSKYTVENAYIDIGMVVKTEKWRMRIKNYYLPILNNQLRNHAQEHASTITPPQLS